MIDFDKKSIKRLLVLTISPDNGNTTPVKETIGLRLNRHRSQGITTSTGMFW
jgi:hypothetical protein